MLKIFLGFLLLANAGLLAHNAGYDANNAGGREPARLKNQLNADRVRIEPARAEVPVSDALQGIPDALAAASSVAAKAVTISTPIVAGGPTQAPVGNLPACLEFGNFDSTEARRFDTQVTLLAPGIKFTRRTVAEIERYIVYLPPTPERETPVQKVAQLRQLGIEDFYVINDNSDLRRGISLGMFKSAEAAQQHLARLVRQGVQDARVMPRSGSAGKVAFQLRGLDIVGQAALEKIKSAFPKQETRPCLPA